MQQTSRDGRQATTRAERASAAVLWVTGMAMEQIEAHLNQHMYNQGGLAGAVRAIAGRTRDLLPAVAAVVRSIDPAQSVDDLAERTMLRLELGIPAELVDLAQAVVTPLARPQWMRLHAAGLVTIDAVEQHASSDLGKVLGDQHVAEVLQQDLRDHARREDVPSLDLPEPSE